MSEIQLTRNEEKRLLLNNIFNSPFFTIVGSVLTTFAIAFLFFKFAGPVPISVSQTSIEKVQSFDVVGESSREVIPDEAVFSLGINQTSPTVKEAQDTANSIMNSITTALVNLGIDKDQIKTTNYSINPRFSRNNTESGYNVNINLQIRLNDFEILEDAIDTAVSLGANNAGGISFSLSEEKQKELEDELTKEAIEEAKANAKSIASAAGVNLGKIINVQVQDFGRPIPFDRVAFDSAALSPEAANPTEISPGTNTITKSVVLSYETY